MRGIKALIVIVILIALAVSVAKADSSASGSAITGETVEWDNAGIGKITVYPHTAWSKNTYMCQYANITSYLSTQDLDFAFKFSNFETIYNKGIWLWKSYDHNNGAYMGNKTYSYTCNGDHFNYTTSPKWAECWNGSTLLYNRSYDWGVIPSETIYWRLWEALAYNQSNSYADWFDIKDLFTSDVVDSNTYYWISDINFDQNETKEVKFCYTPTSSAGKWELLAKRSSDSLSYALANDLYVELDPWWNETIYDDRTCFLLNNPHPNDLTNVSFQFHLNMSLFVNTSGCDVAWTNTTETVGHYNLTNCIVDQSGNTTWLVNSPVVSTANTTKVCITYRNSSDKSPDYTDITKVGIIGDDFNDNDITDWTNGQPCRSGWTGTNTVASGVVTASQDTGGMYKFLSGGWNTTEYVLYAKMFQSDGDGYLMNGISNDTRCHSWEAINTGADSVQISRYVGGSGKGNVIYGTGIDWGSGWYTAKTQRFINGSTAVYEPITNTTHFNKASADMPTGNFSNITSVHIGVRYANDEKLDFIVLAGSCFDCSSDVQEAEVPSSNSAPSVESIFMLPALVYQNESLQCQVTPTDPDAGDVLTAHVDFYLNGSNQTSLHLFNQSVTNGTATNFTVTAGNTSLDDIWICGAAISDQTETSSITNSSSETVLNHPPVVWATLESGAQQTNHTITSSATLELFSTCQDIDAASYLQNILWVDNVLRNSKSTPLTPALNGSNLAYSTVALAEGDKAFWFECNDSRGSMTNSSVYNISIDTPPTVNLRYIGEVTAAAWNTTGTNVTAEFNITDNQDNNTCHLMVNNTPYHTIEADNATNYNISANASIAEGIYDLKVICNRSFEGNSTAYQVRFDHSAPWFNSSRDSPDNGSVLYIGSGQIHTFKFNFTENVTQPDYVTLWFDVGGDCDGNVSFDYYNPVNLTDALDCQLSPSKIVNPPSGSTDPNTGEYEAHLQVYGLQAGYYNYRYWVNDTMGYKQYSDLYTYRIVAPASGGGGGGGGAGFCGDGVCQSWLGETSDNCIDCEAELDAPTLDMPQVTLPELSENQVVVGAFIAILAGSAYILYQDNTKKKKRRGTKVRL